jgi:U3 small nucleolar ribonucleoprotein protein IMP4
MIGFLLGNKCYLKILIFLRHHIYRKEGRETELKELGARFEMRLYQIKLGTVEIEHAEKEWILRPHMNTAKKRNFL